MRRQWIGGGAAALAVLFQAGAPAQAQAIDEVRLAFAEGRFLEAADLGEAAGTSESYALAARSLSIHGYHLAAEEEKQALFERAMAAAKQAVSLNAADPEAHMQSAHAMGRYAQTVGILEALGEGFAERTRAAIDNALILDPEHVGARLALAGWHAEIVNSAGFMAGILYGATEEDALAHYETAYALAPDRNVVCYDYAAGLLKLDDDYADRARALLEQAIALPADNAYGEIIRERAREALAALDEN